MDPRTSKVLAGCHVFSELQRDLHQCAVHFIENGIGYWEVRTREFNNRNDIDPGSPQFLAAQRFTEALAKELGRPFLWAQKITATTGFWINLEVPRVKRLEIVAACLHFGSHQVDDKSRYHQRASHQHPLVERPMSNRIEFEFFGKKGEEIFQGFIEKCRSDPVTCIALKKPVYPTR